MRSKAVGESRPPPPHPSPAGNLPVMAETEGKKDLASRPSSMNPKATKRRSLEKNGKRSKKARTGQKM